MASQKDTQEEDAKAQLLAQAFQKEGLDAGFWLPKVSQILGIECKEALQHLEYEDYLKLECEVRHPWEKKALRKLLNITDDKTASKELQKEHVEKTKQRQEVAKQALKDLTEMLNSHSHSEDVLREQAETLWRAMEIPKEFWPSPKEPLADMLQSIHKQLEQQQEMSAGRREKIPDTEVLRRASGGLALQGIYRTSRAGDVLATREQLLRVPEGFQLSGPEQGSVLERREFSSSAAESTFTKSMEQLGYSMSVSAKFAFLGINLGVGVDHSSSSQSQDTHQSHSEQSYFCTTKFQYIPLASCYFQRHQLRLSDAALRELQDMEQILGVTGKEDNSTIVKMCERFFSRFGSHINQGPLHFGGIFWWKASTEGFRAEQWEEVKRQTTEALNSFVRKSYGDLLGSAAGDLDVSISISQASVRGRARESSHSAIQLYMANTGGPADTTSLPQWKTGLVSDNTTWCVIDRGFELIPVWDVILCNHRGDFESVGQMSRALRDVYKVLTNESIGTIFGEELGSAVQEARDFMEIVKAWEVTVDERKLLRLIKLKDDLNAKTRNHSVWINVCLSHKALQDFLVNTVRSCQKSPPENTTFIKVMLRSLLDPHIYSVKDFPEASFIMQWIFQTGQLLPRPPNISELQGLTKTLREMTDDFLRQTPATKLAFCQLALPLLLPNPGTSQIEFPLYALSQIQQSWKVAEKSGKQAQTKSYKNKLIFQAQTPIVSFIRIGSSASSSKSQLLNALLSKRKHDTFFHRHCRGSTRERLLMEGVVEIAWYCPCGSLDDTFESSVAFCNLHGDARDHGAQLQFLQDISAVTVALVSDLEQMDTRGKKLLQELWQSQRPLVCLLMEKENVAAGKTSKKIKIGIKNRNEAELMDQLTKIIRDLLEGSKPCFSLDACADKARQHGFVVDADQPACVAVKVKAKDPVKLLKKEKLSDIKPQLKELKESLLNETNKKCEDLTELQQEQRKLDARKREYEDELLRRSRELAVTLKGKSLSETQLNNYFTLVWNCWIAEIFWTAGPPEGVDIDAEIDGILLEYFEEPGFHARIRSSMKERGFSFDMEKHVIKKKVRGFYPDPKSISNSDMINLKQITDNIIARVRANIDKKEQAKQDYSQNFIHEILNEVQKGVNSAPSNAKCTFNREYSIDLSLYLCKMAAERFKAMHEAFQKANDPVMYLNSKREDFFQCFQISCQGATSITTFVVFLCGKIEPALRKAVFERTARGIAEDIKSKFPDFRSNRANLEVCILRYLAKQENFEYFKQYLTSPKEFFQSYIETRVKSHCLDGSKRLRMFLDPSLESLYGNILSAVCLSTQIVKDRKDREDKISLWLDEFCRQLAEVINLPRSELKGIEHQEVTDIEFLSSAMAEALYDLRDRLMKELGDADMSSFSRQPHNILAEHFSGCWEQCPFCGAVCTNTIQNHDGDHQPVFHRPQALTGFRCRTYLFSLMYNPQTLIIDTCSSLIVSDALFKVHDFLLTPYRTYRDAGPPYSTWNILPDSPTQAYWKWFVSHFRTQLEDLYNGKFQGEGEIPEAWQRITKQEALSELDRL
ncbi:interferon-induced very large GTPase 1-like [Catharus ustulatus]|uniref:interferon-induced very large GTPase 1-like n=1 Tax=Catharus ustulatus TaxID=91951 RepID=UPI001407B168|nr:interferon-induced very large GTPase 1-like [Catharus ustulatus]